MPKPKLIERPNCQIGYLKRAREMQQLAQPYYKDGKGDKSLSWVHEHVIKPRFGNSYRTFLRAWTTDTHVLERRERERDESERLKLRNRFPLTL